MTQLKDVPELRSAQASDVPEPETLAAREQLAIQIQARDSVSLPEPETLIAREQLAGQIEARDSVPLPEESDLNGKRANLDLGDIMGALPSDVLRNKLHNIMATNRAEAIQETRAALEAQDKTNIITANRAKAIQKTRAALEAQAKTIQNLQLIIERVSSEIQRKSEKYEQMVEDDLATIRWWRDRHLDVTEAEKQASCTVWALESEIRDVIDEAKEAKYSADCLIAGLRHENFNGQRAYQILWRAYEEVRDENAYLRERFEVANQEAACIFDDLQYQAMDELRKWKKISHTLMTQVCQDSDERRRFKRQLQKAERKEVDLRAKLDREKSRIPKRFNKALRRNAEKTNKFREQLRDERLEVAKLKIENARICRSILLVSRESSPAPVKSTGEDGTSRLNDWPKCKFVKNTDSEDEDSESDDSEDDDSEEDATSQAGDGPKTVPVRDSKDEEEHSESEDSEDEEQDEDDDEQEEEEQEEDPILIKAFAEASRWIGVSYQEFTDRAPEPLISEKLGSHTSCRVNTCWKFPSNDNRHGTLCVVKRQIISKDAILQKSESHYSMIQAVGDLQDWYFEFHNLRKLGRKGCPENIVRYKGYAEFSRPNGLFERHLYMEKCDGDLSSVTMRTYLGEHESLKLLIDLVKGLSWIHGNKIVHNDLTPSNVLYVMPEGAKDYRRTTWKIGDFRLAKKMNAAGKCEPPGERTYAWMSPERRDFHDTPSEKADVWGAFVIWLESKGLLDPADPQSKINGFLRSSAVREAAKETPKFSDMGAYNPNKRPRAEEVVARILDCPSLRKMLALDRDVGAKALPKQI